MSKLGVDQYTGNTYARDRKIKQAHVHVSNPVQVMSCFYIGFQVILAQVPFISSHSSGFFSRVLSLFRFVRLFLGSSFAVLFHAFLLILWNLRRQ